jgi:hypothetical protein
MYAWRFVVMKCPRVVLGITFAAPLMAVLVACGSFSNDAATSPAPTHATGAQLGWSKAFPQENQQPWERCEDSHQGPGQHPWKSRHWHRGHHHDDNGDDHDSDSDTDSDHHHHGHPCDRRDGGTRFDGGTRVDAGVPAVDAGSPATDAGVPAGDAGFDFCPLVRAPGGPLGAGQACLLGGQCLSGDCANGVCQASSTGELCDNAGDCVSLQCSGNCVCFAGGPGGAGSPCTVGNQCLSESCTTAACDPSEAGQACRVSGDCNPALTCVNGFCL